MLRLQAITVVTLSATMVIATEVPEPSAMVPTPEIEIPAIREGILTITPTIIPTATATTIRIAAIPLRPGTQVATTQDARAVTVRSEAEASAEVVVEAVAVEVADKPFNFDRHEKDIFIYVIYGDSVYGRCTKRDRRISFLSAGY